MVKYRFVTGLLFCLGLVACASGPQTKDAMLTYETVPEGAQLFEGDQALGEAPVSRSYKHDGKSEAIRTPLVTAVWPSGAKETFWTTLPTGADRVASIQRPKDAPGLQADLDKAKKLALTRERDAQRNKDAIARDVARASARCKEQLAKRGTAPINDC